MWYESYFTGLPQQAWKAAQTPEQDQLDLEMLVESLELGPGDRVLDVFCGYGRHALPMARLGLRVTGVDISKEYTDELRQAARRDKLTIDVLTGDILTIDLPTPGSFDAAHCIGNSFSFFPRATMVAFLRRVRTQLRPGGRFVAHTSMVAEVILPAWQERNWMAVGEDMLLLLENEYDSLAGRIDSRQTYIHQGVTDTRLAQHYLFTLAELAQLLIEAGFSPAITLCGDTDGRPFALGDEAAWLVAEV